MKIRPSQLESTSRSRAALRNRTIFPHRSELKPNERTTTTTTAKRQSDIRINNRINSKSEGSMYSKLTKRP